MWVRCECRQLGALWEKGPLKGRDRSCTVFRKYRRNAILCRIFYRAVLSMRRRGDIRDRDQFTAISRKVVGKSARDNPERYCGWFWVHHSSKTFKRMAREAMDVCLRMLKESSKGRLDSYCVRNSVLIVSHVTFRVCRVHFFSDNLSRNSCINIQ